MCDPQPTTPRCVSKDMLAALDRETLARLCYAANQPAGSVGLPFVDLYEERQEWWRAVGDRLRAEVERAIREQEEGTRP